MSAAELGARSGLVALLEDAQRRGFLGREPVESQLGHSENLAAAVGPSPGSWLDLGSGAGVPGLVLALAWPESEGALLDASRRRCAHLEAAVARLGLWGRIRVHCGRAEDLARVPELREAFDLVVARSFARPAVTAECAVGFLHVGGRMAVTEPPDDRPEGPERWPTAGLRELGFGPATPLRSGTTGAIVAMKESATGDRWPRAVGRPAKSPIW